MSGAVGIVSSTEAATVLDRQDLFVETPVQEVPALFPCPVIEVFTGEWHKGLYEMQKFDIRGIEAVQIAIDA